MPVSAVSAPVDVLEPLVVVDVEGKVLVPADDVPDPVADPVVVPEVPVVVVVVVVVVQVVGPAT